MKKYLLFALLFILLMVLGATSPIRSLDSKSLYALSPGHFPHPGIAILAIDNKSISELGRWPWPRTIEARVIEKLKAFSPQTVGIDINFSETENAANDAALKESLQSASFPVVLPVQTIHR